MNYRLFALLLIALLPRSAAAADVSDADRATARALAAEGHEALDNQDYATAADRFARADGLIHAPTLMLGLARAQVGQGKLISAQETYLRIIREGVRPGSPRPFFRALEDAKIEVNTLAPRIPFVILEVKGSGAAQITIDGHVVPSQALGVKRPIDPGQHFIRATADGYVAAERTVTLVEGTGETVSLELKPVQAENAAPAGESTFADRRADSSTARDAAAQAGSTQKTIGIIALGIGGAGLVLGGVTGGLAIGKHGVLTAKCTLPPGNRCPLSEKAELDGYNRMGMVSTAGFVVGGAAAVLGTVLILTAPKAKPKRDAWVSPVLGLGYAAVEGGF